MSSTLNFDDADFIIQLPPVDESRVNQLLGDHFGIRAAQLTALTGYDDLNFLVDNAEFADDTRTQRYGRRFVCKFSNRNEARYPLIVGG